MPPLPELSILDDPCASSIDGVPSNFLLHSASCSNGDLPDRRTFLKTLTGPGVACCVMALVRNSSGLPTPAWLSESDDSGFRVEARNYEKPPGKRVLASCVRVSVLSPPVIRSRRSRSSISCQGTWLSGEAAVMLITDSSGMDFVNLEHR